jgi:hypothetical protein
VLISSQVLISINPGQLRLWLSAAEQCIDRREIGLQGELPNIILELRTVYCNHAWWEQAFTLSLESLLPMSTLLVVSGRGHRLDNMISLL